MANYDPHYISSFYDEFGEREWERFERSAADRVNFRVHLHHLQQFVTGDNVLDAGAQDVSLTNRRLTVSHRCSWN